MESRIITMNEPTRGFWFAMEILRHALTRRGAPTSAPAFGHGSLGTRPELAGPDVRLLFMPAGYGDANDRAKLDSGPGMAVGVCRRPEAR